MLDGRHFMLMAAKLSTIFRSRIHELILTPGKGLGTKLSEGRPSTGLLCSRSEKLGAW